MTKSSSRLIFRPEVIRRYIQEKEKTVVPRYLTPPFFIFKWTLLGILISAMLLACWIDIPIFVNAKALVQKNPIDSTITKSLLLILLPATYCPALHRGQQIFYRLSKSAGFSRSAIIKIDSTILNPRKADSLLQRCNQTGVHYNEPVIIAEASFTPPSECTANDFEGSVLSVRIIVGYQKLISSIPIIGNIFKATEYKMP